MNRIKKPVRRTYSEDPVIAKIERECDTEAIWAQRGPSIAKFILGLAITVLWIIYFSI